MPFLNVTFKIEQDFTNIDQTTKDGHDWAARVMIGYGKKIGSKLLSLSHSSFLDEGFKTSTKSMDKRQSRLCYLER